MAYVARNDKSHAQLLPPPSDTTNRETTQDHSSATTLHFGQPRGTFVLPRVTSEVAFRGKTNKNQDLLNNETATSPLSLTHVGTKGDGDGGEEELHSLVNKIMVLQRRRSIVNQGAMSAAAKAAAQTYTNSRRASIASQRRGSTSSPHVNVGTASNSNGSLPLTHHFGALMRLEGALSAEGTDHNNADGMWDDSASVRHAVWQSDVISSVPPLCDMYDLAAHQYVLDIDEDEDEGGHEFMQRYTCLVDAFLGVCRQRHDKRGLSMTQQENRVRQQREWRIQQERMVAEVRSLSVL
jgi:hypothetical protein